MTITADYLREKIAEGKAALEQISRAKLRLKGELAAYQDVLEELTCRGTRTSTRVRDFYVEASQAPGGVPAKTICILCGAIKGEQPHALGCPGELKDLQRTLDDPDRPNIVRSQDFRVEPPK